MSGPAFLEALIWRLTEFNGSADFADDVSAILFEYHGLDGDIGCEEHSGRPSLPSAATASSASRISVCMMRLDGLRAAGALDVRHRHGRAFLPRDRIPA